MQEKVLITYVKDGERTPSFLVVEIGKIPEAYRSLREITTSPVSLSLIEEYE